MSSSSTTVDHDEIRQWAEERGGRPSVVRTGRSKGGVLRLDFQEKEENFDEVSWDEFFEVFEQSQLAFLKQDQTADGEQSRFNKFVKREGEAKAGAKRGSGKAAAGKAAGKTARAKAASGRAETTGSGKKAAGKAASAKAAGGKSAAAKSGKAPAKTAAAGKKPASGKTGAAKATGKRAAKAKG